MKDEKLIITILLDNRHKKMPYDMLARIANVPEIKIIQALRAIKRQFF